MKKELIIFLILVLFLYPISAANMYNHVYNGSSWVPSLSTADGQQKYWINMANATYGSVSANLTVGENVVVGGSLNVTGISYLGNTKINAENVSFTSGGELFANASSIYYNNGSSIFDVVIKNVPENAVMSFNQATCPAGWILADGTSGTPDLRGIFIRGAGISGIMQYANATLGNMSATYGEYLNDSFQGHWHEMYTSGDVYQSGTSLNRPGPADKTTLLSDGRIRNATSDHTNGEPRTGAETAPASYALIYCVKTAEDSASSNSIWQTIGNIISPVNSSKTLEVVNLNVTGNLSVEGQININGASRVRVYRNAAQSLTTNTNNIILYDTETFDNLDEYNTSNGRFTAKEEGYYSVSALATSTAMTLETLEIWMASIYKNGLLYNNGYRNTAEATVSIRWTSQINDLVYLDVGDYVQIGVYHNQDASVNTQADTLTNYLSIHKLS